MSSLRLDSAIHSLELNRIVISGHLCLNLVPALYASRERTLSTIFSVSQKHLRTARHHRSKPVQEVFLARMRAESSHAMDGGFHGDSLAKNANLLRAIDQCPAYSITSLVADDQHGGLRLPQVVSQMMQNAAGIAHPSPGENHAGPFYIVERARLCSRDAHF